MGSEMCIRDRGWIDGSAIIFAVLIVVVVSSVNNYTKELQFRKLMMLRGERNVMVKRNGGIKNKSIYKLLVGDIIFVNQGDQIPADCILITGTSLMVDEAHQTGESVDIEKNPLNTLSKENSKINPFLLCNSTIKEGKGEAVVCAVGINTSLGKIESALEEASDPTPLQLKLEDIVKGKSCFIIL